MYGREVIGKSFDKIGGVVVVKNSGDGDKSPHQSVCALHGRSRPLHDAVMDVPDMLRTAVAQNSQGWVFTRKGGLCTFTTPLGRVFSQTDSGKPFFTEWTNDMIEVLEEGFPR